MTNTAYAPCPSPSCTCDSCITEYVKDYENGEPIYYPDEYIGAWGTYSYGDWN